jgi:hypothetical protein
MLGVVVSGQWSVVSGQLSVVSCQWSVVSERSSTNLREEQAAAFAFLTKEQWLLTHLIIYN